MKKKVILVVNNFRIVVIGLGTQGKKRRESSGEEFVFGIDPIHSEAHYRSIFEVPINLYDAAFVCTPESEKIPIIKYLIDNDKHVLCEKPLMTSSIDELKSLEESACKKGIVLYTAYNHRFEPAIIESAKIVDSEKLGKLYKIRIFYGNGTAKLVKESVWRDSGTGVVSDIGSHLIDLIDFLLPNARIKYKALRANAFENIAYDHALISSVTSNPLVDLEMTFCSWRNTFTCDVFGESGSLHIQGLCKWGPSNLILRQRKFPSGFPAEELWEYPQGDPTWKLEYAFFKELILNSQLTDLSKDLYIMRELKSLAADLGVSP